MILTTINLKSIEFKFFPLGNVTRHSHLLNNKTKMINRSEDKLLHNLQSYKFPTNIVTKRR